MFRARARHILVSSEAVILELKDLLAEGADFAALAREHSSCPSGASGGDLGEFMRGHMVPEFDAAVFEAEVGTCVGPVKTEFGYHLIEVTERR